jgi:DUF4097 and DUF4098 domain-containing protein YvlB
MRLNNLSNSMRFMFRTPKSPRGVKPMLKNLRYLGAWFALALLAAFAAAAARADATGHFDKTLTVTGPVDLDVTTGSGNISIRPGDASKVEIHATIRAHEGWNSSGKDAELRVQYLEQHPPIEQDGNTIRIGHVDDRELMRNISISYEIVTPAKTHLHSTTGSGDQSVQGIAGPLESTTGSGDIRASSIGSDVTVRTGSGDVTLDQINGGIHVGTGSGTIHANGISGSASATTGSGDVILTQTGSGDVEVSTGSGSVEVNGVKGGLRVGAGSGNISARGTPAGDWRMHTGSGDLTVAIPQQSSFELYAHTSSGSIDSKFPITVQGNISPRDLHGKVGSGGNLMDLRTSSGTIHIETQ